MNYKGFTSVRLTKPPRNKFDLSHEKRLSTRMGRLTPIFISEVIPNDTFNVKTEVFLRLAPMIAPVMHRVNVFVHFFYVPNRLLWRDWELFITGGRLGTESPPTPPRVLISAVGARGQNFLNVGSLMDYLGWPPITDSTANTMTSRHYHLLPLAAYQKVWYDYYRDRNYVEDNTILPLPSGTISDTQTIDYLHRLRTRCWEHDYFTSALPWVQRGSEVLMPLVGSGTVNYKPFSELQNVGGGNISAGASLVSQSLLTPGNIGKIQASSQDIKVLNIESVSINNSSVTINELRRAVRLQEWLERNALAGSRYNESILAHFGRRSSDARLQRAEYLGGGKVAVNITDIVTTAWSKDGAAVDVPPAAMAGYGSAYGNENGFRYNCEEHGFIIGIMSVMPRSAYMQGVPRMFRRRQTFLDYPWPSFGNLGEQPVYRNELWLDSTTFATNPADDPIFGYQSRYADWKDIPSSSHGVFRTSLDFWHLTRKFSTAPVLSEAFVTFEDSLQNRIFAVSNVDTVWVYLFNHCTVKRALPYYGTPTL
jgi:hypothetical protein